MKYITAILFLFLSAASFAQTLSGTLLDEQSHPLSFVNVVIVKAQAGSYSDEAGKFSIDVSGLQPSDEIAFSHLGYMDIRTTVSELSVMVKDPIHMQPKNYSLHEVVIGPGGARELLMDALSRIKDNYPAEFTNNHIIFKDYALVDGEKYMYNNFDFNMYIPSYLAKDSPRIYTVDNKHERYEKKGVLMKPPSIKPTVLLKLMYPERLFDKDLLEKADFQMATSSTTIDGDEYDIIEFNRSPQKQDPSFIKKGRIYFKGHVYINKKDQGIRFIDFSITNEKSERFLLLAKMDSVRINAKIAYVKVDGKYMLDYISQSFYGYGNAFGIKNIAFTSTARVIDRQPHLKMNQIIMKTEVDDVFTNEKPRDIKELKAEPDMR